MFLNSCISTIRSLRFLKKERKGRQRTYCPAPSPARSVFTQPGLRARKIMPVSLNLNKREENNRLTDFSIPLRH
jgi:hypothetical protein